MSETYRCGHPKSLENSAKVGSGRTACRICKAAANRLSRVKLSSINGSNLLDPNRADKLLRRFSWEAAE